MAKEKKEKKEIALPIVGQNEHTHGDNCCSHGHGDDVDASIEEVLEFMQDRCEDILVNIRELQDAMSDLEEMVEDDVTPISDYVSELKNEFKKLSFLVDSMVYAPDTEGEEGNN